MGIVAAAAAATMHANNIMCINLVKQNLTANPPTRAYERSEMSGANQKVRKLVNNIKAGVA